MPIPKIEARSSTMSQRLGFHDPDLTSPEHDAMVFWVKNYLKKDIFWTIRALQQIHKAKIANEKFISHIKDYLSLIESDPVFSSLEENTRIEKINLIKESVLKWENRIESICWQKTLSSMKKEISPYQKIRLERPVKTSREFIVGYIDIEVNYTTYFDLRRHDAFGSKCYSDDFTFTHDSTYIEIKPKIQSFGELVRQINTYRAHLGDALYGQKWYVACPDDRHKDNLADENIGFIHITEDYKEYL
jgi:hypothetical protein